MNYFRVIRSIAVLAAFALAGCSSSKMLVSEWASPAYVSPSFKRIMVAGVDGQSSIRRNFEDEFVAQLRGKGVDALTSYAYIPEESRIDDVTLKQTAKNAGADALVSVRTVNIEQKTDIGPSYYPVPGFGIFGRHFGASWYGPYGAPTVNRYEVYTSEATLFDLAKNEVVWTGTLKTAEPDNINEGIRNYVGQIIRALEEKNLLGAKK
jgi:uncharacterized protein YbjQ (UPF0145 family)